MKSADFPALEWVVRSSTLWRLTAHAVETLRTAGSTSRMNALVEMLRDKVSRLRPAVQHRSVGIVLIAAAVTCFGGSWLQRPHQKSLALPAIAIALFIIGGALVLGGDVVATALKSSRLWSLCRRFIS